MREDEFIITVYCFIEEKFENITKGASLRQRGPQPNLTDVEVLTMIVVGEYLGLGSDKKIWKYFKMRWEHFFPNIGCRTSFVRQGANLFGIMNQIHAEISEAAGREKDLFLFDGFPIPVCNINRYKRSNRFYGEGGIGYCAAKDDKYFGFKGHLIITPDGQAVNFALAAANIDERDVLPGLAQGLSGNMIGDKGLIRPELTADLEKQGLRMHTPLRKNMQDSRPKSFVYQLMNIRRRVETTIGQLVERFKIQAIRAKDMWHLMTKALRIVISHSICFIINKTINPDKPLQLENILCC
jgi:hypothetical protein